MRPEIDPLLGFKWMTKSSGASFSRLVQSAVAPATRSCIAYPARETDAGLRHRRRGGTGDTVVEDFQSHRERVNNGMEIVRIRAVFAGAEGTENTIQP